MKQILLLAIVLAGCVPDVKFPDREPLGQYCQATNVGQEVLVTMWSDGTNTMTGCDGRCIDEPDPHCGD